MTEPKRLHLSESEAKELLRRLEAGELEANDYSVLGVILKSWLWLSGVVRHKQISIKELKKLIFGTKTEKTHKVLKSATQEKPNEKNDAPRKKRKGHGRNGADTYSGAERVCLKCTAVRPGDRCPECGKGKLYPYKPGEIVCIRGQAPIQATVYEQERLRCNLCVRRSVQGCGAGGGDRSEIRPQFGRHDGTASLRLRFSFQPPGSVAGQPWHPAAQFHAMGRSQQHG